MASRQGSSQGSGDYSRQNTTSSPELQIFLANLETLVLALKHDLPGAIAYFKSKFIIESREVDFQFTPIGPEEKVRRFLEVLEDKIKGDPAVFGECLLEYLISSLVNENLGRKLDEDLDKLKRQPEEEPDDENASWRRMYN